ncbi:uncharacterized protein LOC106667032 isoform X3 [Cimex lectularius]|uniref:Uncharacterized protein n=1 Tax=Cimex lectularius TaxID=79782 RepID=A0A8I6TIN7_CIMLE|nr:uncharacterized protein LOC106667032 isoform X3 [Cimex lectularius]XP_024081316.1 uncharacterized protein LOC106667032 isoform X3 [Cimex lectularius]
MMLKYDKVNEEEFHQITVKYIPPRPELVSVFVPGLMTTAINTAGGPNVFLHNPAGKLPPLMHIARSYIIAGRSARSEQHKRKIMQKSWMTMNVSKKELDDWVYKGNIHPEGLYKLRNYVIRMRRETRRKKLEWIQDARDILSRVKVPELTEKEVSYLAFYTEEDKVENVEQSKLAIALRHVVGKINSSAQEVSAGLATGISAAILFCYVLFRVLPVN